MTDSTGASTSDQDSVSDADRVVGADRVLAILTELAAHPDGVSLDELSRGLSSSKATVHRGLAALRRARFATQSGRGQYRLGDEFLRLAFRYADGRSEAVLIEPLLRQLSFEYNETAHYAVLDGNEVVYRVKVDPPAGAVRLTSTIGGRNPAYRTAVGKLLLSQKIDSRGALVELFKTTKLVASTQNTIVSLERLWIELQATRERGFAVDDEENEIGVNCVALPLYPGPTSAPVGAVSISALRFRCPLERLIEAIPDIRRTIEVHTSPTMTTSRTNE